MTVALPSFVSAAQKFGASLTPRWTPLRYHGQQRDYAECLTRFTINASGRRSGKTEIAKRRLVRRAMNAHRKGTPFYRPYPDPRFFAAAPTINQAKRIYWDDLIALVPKWFLSKPPNHSNMQLFLLNGAEIHVLGMERSERAEGTPWDHGLMDEIANMRPSTWSEHIRPALSDRNGTCDFVGVPEGRNHYYQMWRFAQAAEIEAANQGVESEWRTFQWPSADILSEHEVESARQTLDELTFKQEYEGSFVNFTGMAYWPWDEHKHIAALAYDPKAPLIFAFDFNVSPGVAVVIQEQDLPGGEYGTGVIGEVWIPRNSNTPMVVRRLIHDWGTHKGRIFCYGDVTGGAQGSASVQGSDWILIQRLLRAHFNTSSEDRVFFKVPSHNPRERDRVNSVNSRLLSLDGKVRMVVDPTRAPHVINDFENVVVVEGGSGEIDKKATPQHTHLTDALGYFVYREYPIKKTYAPSGQKFWK